MRTVERIFGDGEYYHIYNRGVDKRIIFEDTDDRHRFFQSMCEFNTENPIGSLYERSFLQLGGPTPKLEDGEKLVSVIAYCLNPNHFHFILKQVRTGGVSEFMKRLSGGYTGYFNNKYKRSGSLFQGKFKSIHVNSNEYLLHLSAYVNLNDHVHQLGGRTPKLVDSKSSWREYMDGGIQGVCEKEIILEQFENTRDYEEFALGSLESIIKRKSELKDIEMFLMEELGG
jgi:putative transposase